MNCGKTALAIDIPSYMEKFYLYLAYSIFPTRAQSN
jgi:hypothetical protein